ncbi:General negative regulator of transcription subunit 3 [Astathelohania contejeani]|uniref:General negative regulator of transcription subunit 3 n=1 Tax=Astathelohania contejeani TaxID=164912 RepID=A0ABQ7HVV7_9MICR|nr:General negative regulator of transcription subunit 3 [Thelohania contejeani]
MRKYDSSKKEEYHKSRQKQQNRMDEPKPTPAEVWKTAAKLLEKQDDKKDEAEPSCFEDLRKYANRIRNTKKKEIDNFYEIEYENCANFYEEYEDRIKNYKPLNPVDTPDFFPSKPIHIFEGPDAFNDVDADTLFFIFYYQPNTIQQYFAAKKLKQYSWRFHTKYQTWFQRLEEPKLITEYYEQGVFLFFDYDVTWSNRKKNDFTFEYKYLENIEM